MRRELNATGTAFNSLFEMLNLKVSPESRAVVDAFNSLFEMLCRKSRPGIILLLFLSILYLRCLLQDRDVVLDFQNLSILYLRCETVVRAVWSSC